MMLAHAEWALRPQQAEGDPVVSPCRVLIEIRREANWHSEAQAPTIEVWAGPGVGVPGLCNPSRRLP